MIRDKDKLIAIVVINGKTYEKDVTQYFENKNTHDDWLGFRLKLQKCKTKMSFLQEHILEREIEKRDYPFSIYENLNYWSGAISTLEFTLKIKNHI